MLEFSLDEPAGVLVKTTLVDFPGRVAGSFFLKGCNLRCPYCYNIGLINNSEDKENLNSINELFEHMEKRKNLLTGFVISGGEPLINPYTPIIIRKAKELGYKVKLDTNGILPDELEALIENPDLKPDFIAMDIKTSPERYAHILCPSFSKFFNNEKHFLDVLKRSIDLISKYPCQQREFRTVLVPSLITKEDIAIIADYLPKDASWQFAQFMNKNCLDPSYNEIYPYSDKEVKEIIDFAKKIIPGANLR